ncbi:MAG TPA: HAD-IB family phosphatase [Candidatus Paceibacterota bacterium]|nr:HAD-IB family phosphatase [Candidatus Paceibacterota bacterium]
MPPKRRVKLAIFDIDGTIFRSSLIIELFNDLVRRGIFPRYASAEVERNYVAWLNRKGHYNDYLMKLVEVFYRHLAGCSTKAVNASTRAVIAWQKDRVHRFPRQLIGDLRRQNYYILVLSNSPEPIVRQFARSMKFDAAIGHELETLHGIYTGRSIVDGVLKPGYALIDKVSKLEKFIADRNLSADLARSVMIGDSEGDLALLSYVGRPIAFNPSLPLARIARQRGWRVVVERKDVVYDIKDSELLKVRGAKPRVGYGKK